MTARTSPGSNPPVNSAAIDTPVTDPMVIRTRLGGMVSVCAPVADRSATRSPGFAPRLIISGSSTGATAAMSAALAPEMPETRYMAATRTYWRPPRTWPSRLASKADHSARHAGHLDQEAEEYEQRHRQEDQMAHALIHASNHHGRGCARCQRDIGEGRKSKGKRDWHRSENHD